jgi:hypothetical protein
MSNTAPAPTPSPAPVPATVDLSEIDEPIPAPGPDGTPAPASTQQGDPAGLGEAGLRALQAERDARAAAERQLRELQLQTAARITELETGSGELSTQVTSLSTENARLRVAVERGVPAEHVHRLIGTTPEELAADADALLALMGGAPRRGPAPDPSQGSRTPAPQTPEAAFAATFGPLLNP